MTVSFRPALTLAAIVSAALSAAALSASAARAMPAVSPAAHVGSSNLVRVHDDGDRYWRRHHSYHRHYYRDHVVDAPFAHVESGPRRTVVDAPFAHVYNGRHGQHIVAPFVDLWVPR